MAEVAMLDAVVSAPQGAASVASAAAGKSDDATGGVFPQAFESALASLEELGAEVKAGVLNAASLEILADGVNAPQLFAMLAQLEGEGEAAEDGEAATAILELLSGMGLVAAPAEAMPLIEAAPGSETVVWAEVPQDAQAAAGTAAMGAGQETEAPGAGTFAGFDAAMDTLAQPAQPLDGAQAGTETAQAQEAPEGLAGLETFAQAAREIVTDAVRDAVVAEDGVKIQSAPQRGDARGLTVAAERIAVNAEASVASEAQEAHAPAPPGLAVAGEVSAVAAQGAPAAMQRARFVSEVDAAPDGALETVEGLAGMTANAPERAQAGRELPAGANQERIISRISAAVSQASSGGRTTVRLRLYPPEMGTVRVEVSSFRGEVTARILTSTAAARTLLDTNLAGLAEQIREAGVDLRGVEVNYRDAWTQAGGRQHGARSEYSQRRSSGDARRDDSAEAGPADRREQPAAAGVLDVLL